MNTLARAIEWVYAIPWWIFWPVTLGLLIFQIRSLIDAARALRRAKRAYRQSMTK